MQRRDMRIDMLKGLAILGVIFTHAVSAQNQDLVLTQFHANQAVNVFIVLMGFNLSRSMSGGGPPTGAHLRRRAGRLLWPLALIAVPSMLMALARWHAGGRPPEIGWQTLLGYLPLGGPGNYFVSILVGLTLIGPLVLKSYRAAPGRTVAAMFLANIAFEMLCASTTLPSTVYVNTPFRFLAALATGFWLADGWSLTSARNRWIVVGALVSVVYLIAYQIGFRVPVLVESWQPLNVVTAPYAGILVVSGLLALPSATRRALPRWLAEAGRASYHIYLVQILYFGVLTRYQLVPLLSDMVRPMLIGYLFFRGELWLASKRAAKSFVMYET